LFGWLPCKAYAIPPAPPVLLGSFNSKYIQEKAEERGKR